MASERVVYEVGAEAKEQRKVPEILMRFIRTLFWLALVTTACELGLSVVLPQVVAHELPRQIGTEISRWLVIFVPSVLGAGIAALATRKRRPSDSYPGLLIGIFVAGFFTLLILAVCLSSL